MIHDLLEFLIFKTVIKNNIAIKCTGNFEEVLLGLFKNNLIVFQVKVCSWINIIENSKNNNTKEIVSKEITH